MNSLLANKWIITQNGDRASETIKLNTLLLDKISTDNEIPDDAKNQAEALLHAINDNAHSILDNTSALLDIIAELGYEEPTAGVKSFPFNTKLKTPVAKNPLVEETDVTFSEEFL